MEQAAWEGATREVAMAMMELSNRHCVVTQTNLSAEDIEKVMWGWSCS